jgi:hypothetical protein
MQLIYPRNIANLIAKHYEKDSEEDETEITPEEEEISRKLISKYSIYFFILLLFCYFLTI